MPLQLFVETIWLDSEPPPPPGMLLECLLTPGHRKHIYETMNTTGTGKFS